MSYKTSYIKTKRREELKQHVFKPNLESTLKKLESL